MNKLRWILVAVLLTLISAPMLAVGWAKAAATREFHIKARAFAYDPPIIRVQQGDRVKLILEAQDVTHGLLLDYYGVDLEARPRQEEESSAQFVADRAGKFRFRCTTVCGPLHPFMVGELIVEPNYLSIASLPLILLAAGGTLGFLWLRKDRPETDPREGWRFELTRFRWIKTLLKQRWFQFGLILPNLLFFTVIMLAAFFGTPVGNANFAIIFVWIVWWALLKLILIPLGGRSWCAMCPIPAPAEWLDHRAFVRKGRERPLSLAIKRWPKRFKNVWLQNVSFLGVALFSAIILTRPWATGVVLLLFFVGALVLSWLYGKRIFCRYICPVSGFTGMYSMVAPLEIRVKDPQVCRQHKEKECIQGSEKGYGCPWLEYPGNMLRNAYCGLCTECLKTCPKDNIAVNLRPFGRDLFVAKGRSLDEAYNIFIMLTCALIYSAVYLGPWGFLKDWANIASLPAFLFYAILFLAANLLVVPGLFYLAVWVGKGLAEGQLTPFREAFAFVGSFKAQTVAGVRHLLRREVPLVSMAKDGSSGSSSGLPRVERLFVDYAYALVPMGLAGWIAFTVSFVLVDISYAIPLLSDPFGWGWDLLGTAKVPWLLFFPEWVPYIQTPIVLAGLVLSIYTAYYLVRPYAIDKAQALRSVVPIAAFLMATTGVFLRLFV